MDIDISHSLFIDHLKLNFGSERQQGIKLAPTHQMMDAMGLSMAGKKTKTISMARGKVMSFHNLLYQIKYDDDDDDGLQLYDDMVIKDPGDSLYKFLGIEEGEVQ